MKRRATHAGSWYSDRRDELDGQLASWLQAVPQPLETGHSVPVSNLRAIIAPHAGYRYSGPAAAYAYRAIDPSQYTRVFVLGPSHHAYLDGCALSRCTAYETPVGDLPLDAHTIAELKATDEFSEMKLPVDEDEHSIEMHLPYIRKVFEGRDIRIVPILVGSINKGKEEHFGKVLAPYLEDPQTLFVISSDFCHWGSRFSYTYYADDDGEAVQLSRRSTPGNLPIHASIERLDRRGMATIAQSPPSEAHEAFAAYLRETRNTICGRHPIGVLLAALANLSTPSQVQFVRYEQSSACKNLQDSSVSYASAIAFTA